MKFIINKKIYDTEKSELVIEFYKKWKVQSIVGILNLTKLSELYRTKKGNWFIVAKGDYDSYHVEVVDDIQVQKILSDHGEIEKYNKYFDELEEA